MPDGATVDRDGLIWMAIFRGHKVVAFRPDGKVERIVDMPVSMAVSVSFGGADLDQLYVTTIDPQSRPKTARAPSTSSTGSARAAWRSRATPADHS